MPKKQVENHDNRRKKLLEIIDGWEKELNLKLEEESAQQYHHGGIELSQNITRKKYYGNKRPY